MWNESHNETVNGGWAAGESSFMTDKKPDSKGASIADRLPVPATITMLRERIDVSEDKYVLGGYRFSTVTTVGIVKEIIENDTTYTYVLADPENLETEIQAAKFVGGEMAASKSTFDPASIVEGCRVRAIGKLKGYNGVSSIMCFVINPVDDARDFKIHELESRAAFLFFTKNMPAKLRSGSMANKFRGMLAPPKSRATPNVSQKSSASSDTKERLYPKQEPTGGADELVSRIQSVLGAVPEDDREIGKEVSWIMAQIGEQDEKQVREALSVLVVNGNAYSTTDEDHYSCI